MVQQSEVDINMEYCNIINNFYIVYRALGSKTSFAVRVFRIKVIHSFNT